MLIFYNTIIFYMKDKRKNIEKLLILNFERKYYL